MKKLRHGRALGFANLHGHQAPGLYQGRPQLGDGPVEHQAVPAAVQSQGGLPPHLRLEGGQLPGFDVGRVGGHKVQAAGGELPCQRRGEDVPFPGGDLPSPVAAEVFLQVGEGLVRELHTLDSGPRQEGEQPQGHRPCAGAQVQAPGGGEAL